MRKFIYLIISVCFITFSNNVCAESASGTIIMEFDLSSHNSDKEANLWIPYPITNKNQTISNIRVDGNYSSSGVYTESKFQNPMLYSHWNTGSKSRKLKFTFDVTRQEITTKALPEKETVWDPADYALYLSPSRLGPINGEVKELADKITAGQTTVLGKAKAIYDWTCENTYRNPETRGCGIGDVYQLLKDPGGKCTDISSIYVALARAANVPAREIMGIRQGKKEGQDISKWQHCWAEFYLPGHGWVPVDPADVRKMMLKQNLSLCDIKTAKYREYFWAGLDPYRIKLGEGKDIDLNPPQSGEPVNYLMYPFAQIGDETLDWLDPETFKYKIGFNLKDK